MSQNNGPLTITMVDRGDGNGMGALTTAVVDITGPDDEMPYFTDVVSQRRPFTYRGVLIRFGPSMSPNTVEVLLSDGYSWEFVGTIFAVTGVVTQFNGMVGEIIEDSGAEAEMFPSLADAIRGVTEAAYLVGVDDLLQRIEDVRKGSR